MTTASATAMPAATVDDWLRLHGIGRAALEHLVPAAMQVPAAPDPPLPAPAQVEMVAAALARALPGLAPLLDRLAQEVRFDLAPDRARFPRAFTIDDIGDGGPFVSCPCRGRTSDLLMLAHEIGHAVQALVPRPRPLPPIQREMAAFITEDAAARELLPAHPATGPLIVARQARALRHGPALRVALAEPGTAYSYGWNYPVARLLARRAAATLPQDEVVRLITDPGELGPLLARLA